MITRDAHMILYFCEDNGDYLAIDTATNSYSRSNFGPDHFEGRATAIAGLVSNCKRVSKASVPLEWRKAIGL